MVLGVLPRLENWRRYCIDNFPTLSFLLLSSASFVIVCLHLLLLNIRLTFQNEYVSDILLIKFLYILHCNSSRTIYLLNPIFFPSPRIIVEEVFSYGNMDQ